MAHLLYLITDITHLLIWGKRISPKSRWPIYCKKLFSDTSNYQQRSKFSIVRTSPFELYVVLIIDVINKTIKANDPLKRVLATKDKGICHN